MIDMVEYGTGWGRTRHILTTAQTKTGERVRSVCGASLDLLAKPEDIAKKPICGLCARARHIQPCTHCGGTGREPSRTT